MNCWEILGLQPGAEERDIKRRYAQLVKNCRPEDDPDAWQKLHDAYEQALNCNDEDQWQEEDEEQSVNMPNVVVQSRPMMTFRAPITLSGHPLTEIAVKTEVEFTWQTVLDMLFEENEATPEHAPMQLAKALSFLEKKDLISRMCFEEALLLHLHQVFRPLLTLAAAETFRWHLVAGSRQPAIQTEINEGCLLYSRIEKEIADYFYSEMSPSAEVENGKSLLSVYQLLRESDRSHKWFKVVLLNLINKYDLSDSYLSLITELKGWSYQPEPQQLLWQMTEQFYALSNIHKAGYEKILAALNLEQGQYNQSKKIESYKRSAQHGSSSAQNDLATMYYAGEVIEKDFAQAIYWFEKSAEQGCEDALLNLALMYCDGKGVSKNPQKAFSLYQTVANKNNRLGQYSLACMYSAGEGVVQDDKLAFKWCQKSAEQGYDEAQYLLATMYRDGLGVDVDYQQTVYWLTLSAGQENSKAEYTLGYMYYEGTEIPQDQAMGISFLKAAAGHGNMHAALVLGQLHLHGREGYLIKNIHQAITYLKQASDGGELQSAEILGMIYYQGFDEIAENSALSFEMFSKAARSGSKRAQTMLSIMYMEGDGTDKNYISSWSWGIISEACNDLDSNDWLPEVRENMSSEDFSRAQRMARILKKRYQL